MSDKQKIENSIDFVASNYEDGALSPKTGWQRFSASRRKNPFTSRAAAACIGAAVLAASASILFLTHQPSDNNTETNGKQQVEQTISIPAADKNLRIEFSDASLQNVVAEIERIYEVKISNIPSENMRITISYEGNAADVVEAINDLLGIELTIEPETIEPETSSEQ